MKRNIRMKVSVTAEVNVDVSDEEYRKLLVDPNYASEVFEADIYWGEQGNAGDFNAGGDYKFEVVGEDLADADLFKCDECLKVFDIEDSIEKNDHLFCPNCCFDLKEPCKSKEIS